MVTTICLGKMAAKIAVLLLLLLLVADIPSSFALRPHDAMISGRKSVGLKWSIKRSGPRGGPPPPPIANGMKSNSVALPPPP
ncbi:hypothetical protein LINPERPRIM_LOCUS19353 [Linum perenne]